MARFNYAVLRLAPDPTRGEAINVGLVVFKDNGVDVRTGEVLTRARTLFPTLDREQLSDAVEALKRFGSVDLSAEERHRTLSQFGAFRLGELVHFSADAAGADTYEAQLERLMGTFVRQPRRKGVAAKHVSRLVTDVRRIFRKEKVLAAVGDTAAIADHKVVPDWPFPNRPSLKADLALRNGAMRVCEIVEMNLHDHALPPPALFAGVVTLDVARQELNATDAVFAYRAAGPRARIDEALGIAALHATTFVNWDIASEREDFLHQWITAAQATSISHSNV